VDERKSKAAVLIVDDRPENLLAMEVVLEPLGLRLVRARSGHEALEAIQRQDFAVILLDVQMPGFDGFQTALRIRENDRGAQTPIVFLTAHSTDEAGLLRGYAEGAVDYISKPIRPEILRTKVKIFVQLFDRIQDCREMGAKLHALNQELEKRVESRTSELTHAMESSRQASHAKSVFLASMSHELRTPLNSILGFAELLEEELTREPETALAVDARKLRQAGEHLLSLVNDLLDLARIEAGRVEYNDEAFKPSEVLQEVAEMMRPLADNNSTRITLNKTANCDFHIYTDRQKLRQIIINLVANAVKFTHDGTVTLACSRCGNGQESLRLEVLDSGPGLSPGQIARLFGEYEKGEPPPGDQVEGTGLGLAISRQLARALGGDLHAQNVPGGGASFVLELPLHRPGAKLDRVFQ
jgi:signal transduction histidine kinase